MRRNSAPGFEERRVRRRYKLRLPMWFCASSRSKIARWTSGEVIDISPTGVRFRSRRPCPIGADVKMAIDWPIKRDDRLPISLVATGVVVHSERGRVGVRFIATQLAVEDDSIAAA